MKLFKLIAVVSVLLGIGAVVFFLWKGGMPFGLDSDSRKQSDLMKVQVEKDLATLDSQEANRGEIFHALTRLAKRENPRALEHAFTLTDHSYALLRRGAAVALSYFDEEGVFEALEKLTRDSDPDVRTEALKSFSNLANEQRKSFLLAEWESGSRSPEEQNAILSSLFHMSSDAEEKEALVLKVQEIFEKAESPQARQRILSTLMTLRPRGAVTIRLLRGVLDSPGTSPSDESLQALAIRHLGVVGDQSVQDKFGRYLQSSSSKIQLAALGVIHRVCPSDRWEILEGAIRQSKDVALRKTAIRALQMMPSQDGLALIEKLLASEEEGAGGDLKTALEETQSRIQSSKRKDPCAS